MKPSEALAIYAWNVQRDRAAAHENALILQAMGLVEYRRQYDEAGRWIGAWYEPTAAGKKAGLK